MGFILTAKEIAELVTSISAAIIVLIQAFKIIPKPIKNFLVKTIPVFFCGVTTDTKKKVRFFKALKFRKEKQEQLKTLLNVLAHGFETEEYLVLNKSELNRVLTESKLFTKVTLRKQ